MSRWIRLSMVLLTLLCSLSLGGCRWQAVTLVIPDFASAAVKGVRLWREANPGGEFVPDAQIAFEHLQAGANGFPSLAYSVRATHFPGNFQLTATAYPFGNDAVALELHYPDREGVHRYRVSTWNAGGESPLSQGSFLR